MWTLIKFQEASISFCASSIATHGLIVTDANFFARSAFTYPNGISSLSEFQRKSLNNYMFNSTDCVECDSFRFVLFCHFDIFLLLIHFVFP